jgi:hypothetical protein
MYVCISVCVTAVDASPLDVCSVDLTEDCSIASFLKSTLMCIYVRMLLLIYMHSVASYIHTAPALFEGFFGPGIATETCVVRVEIRGRHRAQRSYSYNVVFAG